MTDPPHQTDTHPLQKIVSGGQTGVDRAALDTAIFLELEHGGWCPRGRRAEDGTIDIVYQLKETPEFSYAARTEKNVLDSDATFILFRRKLTGGTKLTEQFARRHRRPVRCVDLETVTDEMSAVVLDWIREHQIVVLNVAGPRESSAPGIARQAEKYLLSLFR